MPQKEVIRKRSTGSVTLVRVTIPLSLGIGKDQLGKNYVERALILAIKHDIALYAIRTNLDNVINGVNGKMADMLGLVDQKVLSPKQDYWKNLAVLYHMRRKTPGKPVFRWCGKDRELQLSFGGRAGSFNGNEQRNLVIKPAGRRHIEPETRVEAIFQWLRHALSAACRPTRMSGEIAYDLFSLAKSSPDDRER